MYPCRNEGCCRDFPSYHGARIHEKQHCILRMRLTHSSDEDDVMTDDEQQVFNSYPEDHNDCLDMPGVVSDEEDDDAPPAEDMKYIRYQEDF